MRVSADRDRLAEIRALCEAATPGPMIVVVNGRRYEIRTVGAVRGDDQGRGELVLQRIERCPDAQFYAAARTVVPELLDRVEAAEQDVERLRDVIREENANAPHALTAALEGLASAVNERDAALARAEAAERERDAAVGVFRTDMQKQIDTTVGSVIRERDECYVEVERLRAKLATTEQDRDEAHTPLAACVDVLRRLRAENPLDMTDGQFTSLLANHMEAVRKCDQQLDECGLCSCSRLIGSTIQSYLRMSRHHRDALREAQRQLSDAIAERNEARTESKHACIALADAFVPSAERDGARIQGLPRLVAHACEHHAEVEAARDEARAAYDRIVRTLREYGSDTAEPGDEGLALLRRIRVLEQERDEARTEVAAREQDYQAERYCRKRAEVERNEGYVEVERLRAVLETAERERDEARAALTGALAAVESLVYNGHHATGIAEGKHSGSGFCSTCHEQYSAGQAALAPVAAQRALARMRALEECAEMLRRCCDCVGQHDSDLLLIQAATVLNALEKTR